MKSELVSIVVLTYRKFDYLEKNIQSILKQNYSNIEIIVQDDGSPNFNYDEINNLFKTKSNNVKNIVINTNRTNYGTVKNFNNAIKLASGNIIIPLSVDDEFYDNNAVTKIVQFFSVNKCRIFTAKRQIINNKGDEVEILPLPENIKCFEYSNNEKLLNNMCRENFISGSSTYYKKDLVEECGYFNEVYTLLEDYPFYLDILLKKEKILFCDEITIKYRLGGVSTSSKTNSILENDFKKVYENIIFKNKSNINISTYREAKLNYFRQYCKEDKVNYILAHLLYFDRIFIKILKKLKLL